MADNHNFRIKNGLEVGGVEVITANGVMLLPSTSTATTQSGGTSNTRIATTAFVQQELTTLIGGAPSTLNDLNELAAAINDDANYNTTLTTALALKAPKASPTFTGTLSGTTASFSGTIYLGATATASDQFAVNNGTDIFIGTSAKGLRTYKDLYTNSGNNKYWHAGDFADSSANWNTAYTYSQVGHVELDGTSIITGNSASTGTRTAMVWMRGKAGDSVNQINVEGANIEFGQGGTLDTTPAFKFSHQGVLTATGRLNASGGNSDQWNTAYTYSQVGHLPLSGGTLTGGLSGTTGTFSGTTTVGGDVAGVTLNISATDTAGSSAMTAKINMTGYEGRGIGIFYKDTTYSGEEWYSGIPYNGGFNAYQIGYDEAGSQAEYSGNSIARFTSLGEFQMGTTTVIDASRNITAATVTATGVITASDTFRGEVVPYSANQDAPYMIAGTSGYTGATTNWSTFGFQHRIKSNSGGTARVTIDTFTGEAFSIDNSKNAIFAGTLNSGTFTSSGVVSASGGNSGQWNTAYGWGNHASAGYLTSFDITTQTDSKYLRSNASDTFGNHTLTIQGAVRSTNNANASGPNFNVSTTNKSTTEYAYRVDRSGSTVGGIRIDGRLVGPDAVIGGATVSAVAIGNWNTAYTVANAALPKAGGTMTGTLNIVTGDTSESIINLYGGSQGTGKLYVGQSTTHGGGIEYNGDGTPASSGSGADYITLYRRTAGVDSWTARNLHNSNDWKFRGNLYANDTQRVFADNYHPNADVWTTARNLVVTLTGDVTGTATQSVNGSAGKTWTIATTAQVPSAPSITATSVVGETIEVTFSQSSTSGVDHYEIWSDGGSGTDYSLIARIPEADIAASMSIVDSSFDTGGTIAYRAYAVKNGVHSTAATATRAYTVSTTLDVASLSVVPDINVYHINYNKPDSRFIDHIEIYKDAEAVQGSLSRTGAALVYSGANSAFTYSIGASDLDKYHQFWVEVVAA